MSYPLSTEERMKLNKELGMLRECVRTRWWHGFWWGAAILSIVHMLINFAFRIW